MAWRAWLPDEPPRRSQALLLGTALAGGATLARLALKGPVGDALPFITYFPALIFAAALGGGAAGLTCLLLSTVAVWLLFLSGAPSWAWAIGSFWISGGLIILVAAALADSVRELRRSRRHLHEAQAKLQTLVGELAHRNRNALAVIMSIVSQSARNAASAEAAAQVIKARLMALARAQQAVIESGGERASLRTLLETALAPFGLERFDLAPSPDAEVEAELAGPLGLLFHEMATNALKHGALSASHGRVQLDWDIADGAARLRWREIGGPPVAEPARQGFGTRLLTAALAQHRGTVERRFELSGVIYELTAPAAGSIAARAQ